MDTPTNFNRPKTSSFNILIYFLTIVVVLVFIYFIYQFLYGTKIFQTNLLVSDILDAKDSSSALYDQKLPNIYEGGECSINFWMYINDYKYKSGTRKHLLEIGGANFSTIIVALGATTPTLLVRVHTMGTDQIAQLDGHNYGITDCSGSNADDCSGGTFGSFTKITDKNLKANMKDNALTPTFISSFFTPFTHMDENGLINSDSTCDVKDIEMQKWVNVSIIMTGRTIDIYLQGKLVKTCVYNNYYKVDSTGVTLKILQGAFNSSNETINETAGFGGQFGRLQIFNTTLTPDEIYKNYLAGPNGSASTSDPLGFIKYIFTGTA